MVNSTLKTARPLAAHLKMEMTEKKNEKSKSIRNLHQTLLVIRSEYLFAHLETECVANGAGVDPKHSPSTQPLNNIEEEAKKSENQMQSAVALYRVFFLFSVFVLYISFAVGVGHRRHIVILLFCFVPNRYYYVRSAEWP